MLKDDERENPMVEQDTAKPYAPQVEAHMELLRGILPEVVAIPQKLQLFED